VSQRFGDFYCDFLAAMQPRKNTHKKLPTGIKKAIIEAQRVGCSRIWRTRNASGTVHRTIKYPKTWPVPSVLIKKYPVQGQAIRNSDKAPDTHQTDFQKPLPAEIRLTEISVITEIKMKTTIRIIIYLTRQSSAAAIAGRASKDNRRESATRSAGRSGPTDPGTVFDQPHSGRSLRAGRLG
jgi:hypothetical protein